MADVGTGATLTFGTSSVPTVLTSIEWSGVAREAIETTSLATTGARTYIPGDLYDPGEISVEGYLNPDDDVPIDLVPEEFTVTFPIPSGGAGGATFAASGFVTEHEISVPMEEEMTVSMTIKLTGPITWTDST